MNTRRSFLYTLAGLPAAMWVAMFVKQSEPRLEIIPDDLLFRARYHTPNLTLGWNEDKGRWEEKQK